MLGTLTIRDREFEVTKATLTAGISKGGTRVGVTGVWNQPSVKRAYEEPVIERCNWMLNIETTDRNFTSDDQDFPERWRPRAYSENLPVAVSSWTEFEGLTIECAGPSKAEKCKLVGPFHLYVYEHADVTHNRLAFSRRMGNRFELGWSGLCDVYGGNEYSEDIPLRVQTQVTFEGVRVVENDLTRATAAMSQFFNPNEFVPRFLPYVGDTGMKQILFEPLTGAGGSTDA